MLNLVQEPIGGPSITGVPFLMPVQILPGLKCPALKGTFWYFPGRTVSQLGRDTEDVFKINSSKVSSRIQAQKQKQK